MVVIGPKCYACEYDATQNCDWCYRIMCVKHIVSRYKRRICAECDQNDIRREREVSDRCGMYVTCLFVVLAIGMMISIVARAMGVK